MSKEQMILKILTDDAEYYGQQINTRQIKMWADDLSDLTPEEVLRGVKQNQNDENRNFPSKPAQIRSAIYNFPTADEAWALIKHDERSSFVWCSEISEAYDEVSSLVRCGDMIAARMAFKDSYNKKVEISKSIKQRPKWFASLGHDVNGRDEALLEAVQKGRLTEQIALAYSETLKLPQSKSNTQIALENKKLTLLTYEDQNEKPLTEEEKEKNLKRTQELLKMLSEKKQVPKDEDEQV